MSTTTKYVLIGRRSEEFIEFGDKPVWYILADVPTNTEDNAIDYASRALWIALNYTSLQLIRRTTAERAELEEASESESNR